MSLLLGLDLGTSGSKALIVDGDGRVRARASAPHPVDTPRPLWSEQDPEHWWESARAAIRDVLQRVERAGARAREIAAVGLSGQMHGAVLLDREGAVVRPCILWNDQRTARECAELTRLVGAEEVVRRTGNPVLTGFTAPKLLWVARNEPELYARIDALLLPKDYLRWRLTGELASDVSDASGTSLFDVARRAWSDSMCEAADVPRSWLPEVAESPEVTGCITPEAARATGLREGTPVVAGAGDQAAQAVGSGVVADGDVAVTVGTSGVVFAACDRPRIDPAGRLHAFCHALPDRWHLMAVVLSAGGSLRWFRDAIAVPEVARARARGVDPYDEIARAAATVPPGAEGLLFLPYLTGERTPHADPDARGAFVGLTLRHTRAHLARAILEGVAHALRDGLDLVRELGLQPQRAQLSGGGARSDLWGQILADTLELDLRCPAIDEGAALGAALLAGVGAGVFASVELAARRAGAGRAGEPSSVTVLRPGEGCSPATRRQRAYRALYPALAPLFAGGESRGRAPPGR